MHHEPTLIATIAAAFVFASACGLIADRFRLPPLLGYLVAGILIGPYTAGYVADSEMAAQLAEVGVILLMFGVGLHFSFADLAAVRWIAVPGALSQTLLATLMGAGMAMLWGRGLGSGLVFGLSLSVASTVVLLRALESRNALDTPNGRIAVGWLIVEDLATVGALVLLPVLSDMLDAPQTHVVSADTNLLLTLVMTFAKVAAFVVLAVTFGPRVVPWLLTQVARTGSRELFTLTVLALALGIAYGSAQVFGVSFALGAFLAGVIMSESRFSMRAAADSLPLQDAFAVLFFVSVGMLFDPSILWREPVHVISVVLLIVVGKSAAAFIIVLLLRFPLATAITVSASLAQIGEFSFILAGLGLSLGLLEKHGNDLILAGALLSITLNPLVLAIAEGANRKLARWQSAPRWIQDFGAAKFEVLRSTLQAIHERGEAREHARVLKEQEVLERFPIFGAIEPLKREEFLLLFRPRSAAPGDRIIRKGDRPDGVYFISSGSVAVSVRDQEIRLGPGEFFGEMALLRGTRRSADVTAIDYCQFLVISARDFRLFVRRNPALLAEIDRLAEERSEMNRRLAATEGER
jgi:CPA2 family monovalent cation:H+ antiporter-2